MWLQLAACVCAWEAHSFGLQALWQKLYDMLTSEFGEFGMITMIKGTHRILTFKLMKQTSS